MGIIINDNLSLDIGITQANTYASFGNEIVILNSNIDSTYTLQSVAQIWLDKDSRNSNKPYIQTQNVSLSITSSSLNTNSYQLLYTELKTNYISTTDV